MGLNIKAAKTTKLHSLDKNISKRLNGKSDVSFNFLGFKFYCYPVGKHKRSSINKNSVVYHNIRVEPSKKSVDNHFKKVQMVLRASQTSWEVVDRLNPIIRGWTNYIKMSDAQTIGRIGRWRTRLYRLLANWQKRTFGTIKRLENIWTTKRADKWTFYAINPKNQQKVLLYTYSDASYSLTKYIPVRLDASVYDGNLAYWTKRIRTCMGLSPSASWLISEQKGKCPICKQQFNILDSLEVDHKTPKRKGGDDQRTNIGTQTLSCE